MEILSVTLKNFKSHSDRHFQFQPGTNAICGENGAGKTSILEAIAWTLFNHRGVYKNEDLIRNGAASAQAVITFISGRDGRTYEVQRCTTKGYTIFDPQLGEKLSYKHIEDEVMPWLRQHLGVAPGTDLAKLFANTIGVPQGTFTADFLQTSENRKKVFDAILKVEEYKQANQEMLSLEKYAKAEVEQLDRSIEQYNETLTELLPLQQKRLILSQEIAENEVALQRLQAELALLQTEKDWLTTQAQQVQQLETKLHRSLTQIEGKQQANALLEQSVQRAKQAVAICTAHRPSYQAYLQAQNLLKELETQTKQRQLLLKQRDLKQKTLAERQTELTKLYLQLEHLEKASAEIERLAPFVQQQGAIETQQAALSEQLQQLQSLKLEQQNLTKQLEKLQKDCDRLIQEIQRIQSLETVADQMIELEQRRDRLQEQLSRIDAAKQFEADLRQLVTVATQKRDRYQSEAKQALEILHQVQQVIPLLSSASVDSALFAIQEGVELNNELLEALDRILADLSEQIAAPRLKQQLQEVKAGIDRAYQQRAEFLTLETKQEQLLHLEEEIQHLQQQIEQGHSQGAIEPQLQAERSTLANQLTQLGDPRGRSQWLAREIQQRSKLQANYEQVQNGQLVIQREISALEEQLNQFVDLDEQIEQQKELLQAHQENYLDYLQHQKDANSLRPLEAELQAAIAQLQQLETDRNELQATYNELVQTYDPQRWQQVETTYQNTRSQADRIAGGLPQQQKLLAELDHRLTVLEGIAEKRDCAQLELKQKEQVRKFITFARKVYKEAGPRITERYVQTISREADRLFRELLNRPNVALEWTRDYEIQIQEGAHTRRLINLSGGEQMCAALAVRLALLRVLADIDIAFFDEPTTNMDRPRRESLAEAIANIKTFRQLFVISHDDTFEKVTENVIMVMRES